MLLKTRKKVPKQLKIYDQKNLTTLHALEFCIKNSFKQSYFRFGFFSNNYCLLIHKRPFSISNSLEIPLLC